MASDISGCSMNEVFFNTCYHLADRPVTPSRNGDVMRMNNIEICLHDPQSRHLYLKGRKNNIVANMAETLWVMAGDNRISPFLDFFLPRAKDYSDDGVVWRGAYGPRIYQGGQLDDISKHIAEEGVETRRNVIGIWNTIFDSGDMSNGTKDIPCNNMIWFWVEDGELMMKVQSRSGDILWGLLNINVFEWTFLQEVVRCLIRNNTDHDLRLGKYYHGCIDAHLYTAKSKQAVDVIANYDLSMNHMHKNPSVEIGTMIKTGNTLCKFFYDIIYEITQPIRINMAGHDHITSSMYLKSCVNCIDEVFKSHGILTYGNQLYTYVMVVLGYVFEKKYNLSLQENIQENVYISEDLNLALSHCEFIDWRNK